MQSHSFNLLMSSVIAFFDMGRLTSSRVASQEGGGGRGNNGATMGRAGRLGEAGSNPQRHSYTAAVQKSGF